MKKLVPWVDLPRAKALDDLYQYCRELDSAIDAQEDKHSLSWQRSDARSIAQRALLNSERLTTYMLSSHLIQQSYRFGSPPLMLTDAILGLVAGDKMLAVAEQVLVRPFESATNLRLHE